MLTFIKKNNNNFFLRLLSGIMSHKWKTLLHLSKSNKSYRPISRTLPQNPPKPKTLSFLIQWPPQHRLRPQLRLRSPPHHYRKPPLSSRASAWPPPPTFPTSTDWSTRWPSLNASPTSSPPPSPPSPPPFSPQPPSPSSPSPSSF